MNFLRNIQILTTVTAITASSVVAQGLAIAPIDHEDPTATGFPFHYSGSSSTTSYPFSAGISRIQYVVETQEAGRTLLNLPASSQITSLTFPAEGTNQSFGESLQLEIVIGHTQKTAANASSTFTTNYTSAPQTVFAQQIFVLPDLNNPLAPGGLSQQVDVPLDTPFTFNGQDNLLVEFRVTANSNGNQAFTYWLDWGFDNSLVQSHGLACPTSSGSTPTLTSTPSVIGENWNIRLTGAPASTLTTLNIGFSLLPTPADLGLIGAPGCTLDTVQAVALTDTTSTSGTKSYSFAVGNNIALWQLDVYSQALSLDLFANPAGLVTSNADQMRLGINPRITMIDNRGSATATTGSLRRNWGQIIYFNYN